MLMAIRAMGVAVDQARIAMFAQQRDDRIVVHIHDRAVLALLLRDAAFAQLGDIGFAFCQRTGEELPLEICIMYLGAVALIFGVAGAQHVAVTEQRRRAV